MHQGHLKNYVNDLADIVHVPKKSMTSEFAFIASVRAGLPLSGFLHLAKLLHITQQELSDILKINPRTLSRRKKSKILDPEESNKLYRLARIYLLALEVLNHEKEAIDWLKKPKIGLNKEIPLDLIDTDAGSREVERLLNQLKYGVYP